MESYERWEPIAGIEAPIAGIEICQRGADLTLHLYATTSYGGTGRDLKIRFEPHVIAFMSHGEFEHPWNDYAETGPVPRADNAPPYTLPFPLLRVIDSEWLASFSPSRLAGYEGRILAHYRICTFEDTVDVLTDGAVTAEWADVVP